MFKEQIVNELLEQIIVIVANSGLPVLLANLAKNFFPTMDGKTDKIVNILVVLCFAAAWFYGYYNPDVLAELLKVYGEKLTLVVGLVQGALTLLISLGLTKPIYQAVKNRIPLLGKSFNTK